MTFIPWREQLPPEWGVERLPPTSLHRSCLPLPHMEAFKDLLQFKSPLISSTDSLAPAAGGFQFQQRCISQVSQRHSESPKVGDLVFLRRFRPGSFAPGKGLSEGRTDNGVLQASDLNAAQRHCSPFLSLGFFHEMFSIPGRKTISL